MAPTADSNDHPNDPTDADLLRQFAQSGSDAPFTQLVQRHIDLVYAAARRQLANDAHLADDVTQAVFLLLAHKARAGRVPPRTVLAGWLHTTTRYAAANARRAAATRRSHEQRAARMSPEIDTNHPAADHSLDTWQAIAPHVDAALARLASVDRNAVLLKFFAGKSHRDVGATLGISEDAARKRITRALDRLRALLHRRDLALPATAALGTLLTTYAAEAAPPTLTAACGFAPSLALASSALAKSTLTTLTWVKATLVAACLAASIMITAAIVPYAVRALRPAAVPAAAARLQTSLTSPAPPIQLAADAPPSAANLIEGTVVTPAGEPLVDAEVLLATPGKRVNAYGPNPGRPRVITEPDGKFSFPRPAGEWQIVVRSETGYAQVTADDLARSSLVIARPWGRIEGALYAGPGGKPLAGRSITLEAGISGNDPRSQCVSRTTETRSDGAGHFAFDRVAAGDTLICQTTRGPGQAFLQSKWECVVIEPEQTTKVDLGIAGPAAVGRLLAPPEWVNRPAFAADADHECLIRVSPVVDKWRDQPAGWETWPPRRRSDFERQWDQTPQGRTFRRAMFGETYSPAPDGTYRVDALRPGRYRIEVYCMERDPNTRRTRVVASAAQIEFTIPQSPPAKDVEIPAIPMKVSAAAAGR